MDNAYAGSDPTILRASITPIISHSSPTPYLENLASLVRQPLPSMAGSNLPLFGFYEAGSRIKGDDRGGILSRAATHLYMKAQHARNMDLTKSSSSAACDLLANLQQVVATTSTATPIVSYDTMDMTASASNSNMHVNFSSSMMIPSKVNTHASMLREQDRLRQVYEPINGDSYSSISPTSFSEILLHAIEISGASTSRLGPSNNLPPETPSHDPESSCSQGVLSSAINMMYESIPATLIQSVDALQYCPNSPSKQDSSAMSAEDSDAERKLSTNISKKRNCGNRKAQQKKVVYVPFCENKQRGEAPPSDTWAWRKYGQKPIKGSPFPRGYYRCSSSRGCPARKQVERSRNDPSMVMVTYTAEHNHPWPISKPSNSSKAEKNQPLAEDSRSQHYKAENLFSSIINSPNRVDEQVVSSMDPLEDDESALLQKDVDLCLSRTSTEGDDVFENLGELPELSAIFSKGYIVDDHFHDEEKFEHTDLL